MVELNNNNLYTIIVVGCGGTGSHFVPFLMQLYNNVNKIKKVILIDGDYYEDKNLVNQKCLEQDASKNKAQVTIERFNFIYPTLDLKYIDNYITNEEQISKLIDGPTILVGCVDNNATRKIFTSFFRKYNTHDDLIYLDSGNGTITRNGQVVIGYKKGSTTTLPCVGDVFNDIQLDTDDISEVGTCMRISQDHPQNLATNILAATVLFTVITNIITFNKIEGNIVYFNADNHTMVTR